MTYSLILVREGVRIAIQCRPYQSEEEDKKITGGTVREACLHDFVTHPIHWMSSITAGN